MDGVGGRKGTFRTPALLSSGLKWSSFILFTWQVSDLKSFCEKRLCVILAKSGGSGDPKYEFKFCLTSCVALDNYLNFSVPFYLQNRIIRFKTV